MTDLSYDFLLGYYRGITGLGDKDVVSQAVKTIADYCREFNVDCDGGRYLITGETYCMFRSTAPQNWRAK